MTNPHLLILVLTEIMNDVIRATVRDHNKTPGKMEWRVLIVDNQSMRMVSACTKMHELSAEGITSKFKKSKSSAIYMTYSMVLFQLLKLLRNVANLYQLWKLFIWSRPRKVAWKDWWRIFNRKTELNIELRMSTLLKVSKHILEFLKNLQLRRQRL